MKEQKFKFQLEMDGLSVKEANSLTNKVKAMVSKNPALNAESKRILVVA